MVKDKEASVFLSNRLRDFVNWYDADRTRPDYTQDFDKLDLPVQMSESQAAGDEGESTLDKIVRYVT